jgi:hypothetical protein
MLLAELGKFVPRVGTNAYACGILLAIPHSPRRFYKRHEKRMGLLDPALKLRVKLHPDKERMLGKLHDFHEFFVRVGTTYEEAGFFEGGAVGIIELVAVAVAFVDEGFLIGAVGEGALADFAGVGA